MPFRSVHLLEITVLLSTGICIEVLICVALLMQIWLDAAWKGESKYMFNVCGGPIP